ncbi:3-deoxy-manno-octulosonate-8-phosphatase [Lysobacter dokdonensis DS-58]|uniref:3-deoxy-D-manno-octulosonate 8-phosphate phosphatase KdsC n=1 Tax=Lysobacter dokdonensis DS-58 TaxID=1300345 RepID=A0A0A2WDE7_9GAMM|nr:HAD hydrolase family protein [Lysobacter dokdonensis]KGQ17758.1 3-deoxy-manno-octulosonate-8-phosphatase [Lysobacter dokdonensis DS-58]
MNYSHLNDYPADIRDRARRIRLACFDVDGTLTDGRLIIDGDGNESKAFHVFDGLGLKFLQRKGIAVAFVTARASAAAERRANELGVESHIGVRDKLACVEGIAKRMGLSLDEVCFMGDDLVDLRVMQQCGLSVAPAQAHPWMRDRVHWRTHARGGEGAAREVCDLILAAQGHAESLLDEIAHVTGIGARAEQPQ